MENTKIDSFPKERANELLKKTKRGIVAAVGLTIAGVGIAMIILPGPAIVFIPLGLALLATEFLWAKRILKKTKEKMKFKRK